MFSGSYVALVTPFANNEVDEAALRKMVGWHIEQGTHGLVPVGTTGESPTLAEAEHHRVVEIVVAEANGRVPVIAGAGSNNTAEAVGYTRHAHKVGANATLHVAGYYNRPSQAGLYAHFEAVNNASELPIIVYNIPPRAVVDISVETMAKLAALEHIVGVKDATCDLGRPARERLAIGDDFCWLSGEDATAVAYNAAGGQGCISVTANVAPALCSQMQSACLDGDFRGAIDIQQRLLPLHDALFREPSPAGAKYAASLLGLCAPDCRLPVVPLSDGVRQEIEAAMRGLNLI
ncbi:MAG: 4-hydroxy-tetrahydrodipicolinate synthase [Pseudomonadota bacterium]